MSTAALHFRIWSNYNQVIGKITDLFSPIHVHSFLDQQVLAFFTHITACIAKNVTIRLFFKEPDGKTHALLDQLLNIIVKEACELSVNMEQAMALIQSMPNMDNKMQKIDSPVYKESEITTLMQMLAFPRPDGKQRVFCVYGQLPEKMLVAIKKVENRRQFPSGLIKKDERWPRLQLAYTYIIHCDH